MATPAAFDTGMLLSILQDVYMRYQDPKIERHGRKKGIQHWRIRPFVPTLVDGKLERRQKPIILGYEGNGWIRIGGMKLACFGSKYGVGNWCWTGYWLSKSDVERLLNWTKFRKWFDVEQATVGVLERYKAGKPLRFRPAPAPPTPEAK